jgi:hypothetical protein
VSKEQRRLCPEKWKTKMTRYHRSNCLLDQATDTQGTYYSCTCGLEDSILQLLSSKEREFAQVFIEDLKDIPHWTVEGYGEEVVGRENITELLIKYQQKLKEQENQ